MMCPSLTSVTVSVVSSSRRGVVHLSDSGDVHTLIL